MKTIQNIRDRFFPKPIQLPSGFFPYQSPPDVNPPYRMQLRLEKDGTGILIINARTVLHLNQTAAEHVYHMVKGNSVETTAKEISKRYNASFSLVMDDARDIQDRIQYLISTPALDPVTFFDFDRVEPYSSEISAPFRLDCALTYKTGEESTGSAPTDRVKRELLTDEWKTILQKAWQAGIPQVVFTGGEPTLRPDLVELIHFTQDQGQVTGLLSNGYRLAEKDYLHSLLQSGLDHVMIVLDAQVPQTWEAIRDVVKEDLFMTVHITLTEQNIGQIESTLQKLDKIAGNNRSLSLSVVHTDLQKQLLEIRDRAILLGFEPEWDLPVPYSALNPVALELENGELPVKVAGTAWLYVEPDGDVLPSQGINRVLGNLLTEPWDSIWKNRG